MAELAARVADAPAAVWVRIDGRCERVVGRSGAAVAGWPESWRVADGPAECLLRMNGALVVEDTSADLRWGCCPLRVSADIRALLAVPLRGADSGITGAVYVVDTVSRRWPDSVLEAVERLAAWASGATAGQAAPWGAADAGGAADVPEVADTDDAHGKIAVASSGPASDPFLTALVETLDVGVAACDSRGRLILYNRALRELRGLPDTWTPSEDLATSLAARPVLGPDGDPLAVERTPLGRALRGEVVENTDVVLTAPGQRLRIAAARAKPIHDGDGRCVGAVVALQEVTDRRRAERFAECELQVARALAESVSVAAAAPAVLEAVARSLQWPHAELWLIDGAGEQLDPVAQWSAPGLDLQVELPAVTSFEGIVGSVWATGRPLWVPDLAGSRYLTTGEAAARSRECARQGLRTVLAVPLLDAGRVQGVLACFADTLEDGQELLTTLLGTIARQIGQFLARRRADELALDLARTKDQFLALVSHEMRTPLTAISTYTELILTDDDQACCPDHRMLLERIDRNTRSLRAIVNDLLDLAALESGRFTICREPIDLVAVVLDAVSAAATAAATAGVELLTALPDRAELHGDAARLRQVLDNLISNGIKYSPHGGQVHLRLDADADADAGKAGEAGDMVLTVSDTGIGIPEAERPRLFGRFYRASTARTHGIPGTGLGLTIVRAIVEAHDGTIGLVDTAGPGATFRVRLSSGPPATGTPD
ncbi:sensor histidine kinase [Cryptosporangium phraense]|nr:ATP-binding protein [Cryptosporangium phraense]